MIGVYGVPGATRNENAMTVQLVRAEEVNHGDWFLCPAAEWKIVQSVETHHVSGVLIELVDGSGWTGLPSAMVAVGRGAST